MTEKHHCLTLKVMKKLWAEGMCREAGKSRELVNAMFPCLDALLDTHLTLLKRLRDRQFTPSGGYAPSSAGGPGQDSSSEKSVIPGVGDILLEQFTGGWAERMCSAYGSFCSQHRTSVSLYKSHLKNDRKFEQFIKVSG